MRALAAWAGVVVLALCVPYVVALVVGSPGGLRWSAALAEVVAPWQSGGWRLLRGGLKWLVPPALVVVVVVAVVRALVAGRWRHVVWALVCGAGTFVAVEAVKLGYAPGFPGYGPGGGLNLSGHVGAVAGACAVVLTTSRGRARTVLAVLGGLALVGVSVGVVAGRWHDVGDVVVAAAVSGAWAAVVGATAALVAGDGTGRRSWGRGLAAGIATAVALVVLGVFVTVPAVPVTPARTLGVAVTVTGVTVVALVLVQLWSASRVDGAARGTGALAERRPDVQHEERRHDGAHR